MEDPKPSYKTGEFYVQVGVSLISLAAALGLIDAANAAELESELAQFVVETGKWLGVVIPLVALNWGRVQIKVATIKARANS